MVTLTDSEIMAAISVRPDALVAVVGEGEHQSLVGENDLTGLMPARIAFAKLEVVAAAPDAPNEYHNIACVVLSGYLFDAPPSKLGNAWANSGAAFILRRYLIRRAVAFTEATA